jgi:hypothetical protein
MMVNVTQLFAMLVRSCLIPSYKSTEFVWADRSSESMNEWLQHCLTIIKDSYTEFLALDIPKEMIELIRNLLFDIRSDNHTMLKLV